MKIQEKIGFLYYAKGYFKREWAVMAKNKYPSQNKISPCRTNIKVMYEDYCKSEGIEPGSVRMSGLGEFGGFLSDEFIVRSHSFSEAAKDMNKLLHEIDKEINRLLKQCNWSDNNEVFYDKSSNRILREEEVDWGDTISNYITPDGALWKSIVNAMEKYADQERKRVGNEKNR